MAPLPGQHLGNPADPVVTALVEKDTVPWYSKKNLRSLYFIMVPTCIGVEMTSGFDSSMMNGLQAVANWDEYFGLPRGSQLGILSASYSLGAIVESPRFLIQKDRLEEARDFFIKYHAEGDESSELVNAEIVQVQTAIKLELEHANLGWRELFKTKGNQRRTIIASFLGLFTQWSGNTLISYYLVQILNQAGITNKGTQTRINLGQTCWSFVNGSLIAYFIPKYLRRRVAYLICTIGLLCVYISWTIAASQYAQTGRQSAGYAVLVMIFLYSPFYNVGYNALTYTFLVELFPYHIRSNGIAGFQLFGRLAGFFNNFVNPIALKAITWKYYITYCVWLGFEILFVYFMFPETSGRTLEELAFLFEGSENNELLNKTTEKQLTHGGHLDDAPVVGAGAKDEEKPAVSQIEKA
ncbi:hypothetical protein ABW19_dt0207748 [Dactylella cylindrospora]|nr:hypothetical protein ABW19_dt0207748 [Dactylella cylindrospora]